MQVIEVCFRKGYTAVKIRVLEANAYNENHTHPTPHSHLLLFGLLGLVIVEDLLLLIQLLESSTMGKRREVENPALKQQNQKTCTSFQMANRSYSSSKVSTSGWQECMVGVKYTS